MMQGTSTEHKESKRKGALQSPTTPRSQSPQSPSAATASPSSPKSPLFAETKISSSPSGSERMKSPSFRTLSPLSLTASPSLGSLVEVKLTAEEQSWYDKNFDFAQQAILQDNCELLEFICGPDLQKIRFDHEQKQRDKKFVWTKALHKEAFFNRAKKLIKDSMEVHKKILEDKALLDDFVDQLKFVLETLQNNIQFEIDKFKREEKILQKAIEKGVSQEQKKLEVQLQETEAERQKYQTVLQQIHNDRNKNYSQIELPALTGDENRQITTIILYRMIRNFHAESSQAEYKEIKESQYMGLRKNPTFAGLELISMAYLPQVDELIPMITGFAAYIRWKNNLYYIDKFRKELIRIEKFDQKIKSKFDAEFNVSGLNLNIPKPLRQNDADFITQITEHVPFSPQNALNLFEDELTSKNVTRTKVGKLILSEEQTTGLLKRLEQQLRNEIEWLQTELRNDLELQAKSFYSVRVRYASEDDLRVYYIKPILTQHQMFLDTFLKSFLDNSYIKAFRKHCHLRRFYNKLGFERISRNLSESLMHVDKEKTELEAEYKTQRTAIENEFRAKSKKWLLQDSSELTKGFVGGTSHDDLIREVIGDDVDLVSVAVMKNKEGLTLFHIVMKRYKEAFIQSRSKGPERELGLQGMKRYLFMSEILHKRGGSPYFPCLVEGRLQTAYEYANGKVELKGVPDDPRKYLLPDWPSIILDLTYLPTYTPTGTRIKDVLLKYAHKTDDELKGFFAKLFFDPIKAIHRRDDVGIMAKELFTAHMKVTENNLINKIRELILRSKNIKYLRGPLGMSRLYEELERVIDEIDNKQLITSSSQIEELHDYMEQKHKAAGFAEASTKATREIEKLKHQVKEMNEEKRRADRKANEDKHQLEERMAEQGRQFKSELEKQRKEMFAMFERLQSGAGPKGIENPPESAKAPVEDSLPSKMTDSRSDTEAKTQDESKQDAASSSASQSAISSVPSGGLGFFTALPSQSSVAATQHQQLPPSAGEEAVNSLGKTDQQIQL